MEEELALELERPDGVEDAETAVEVLRAWIGDGALLVSLNSSAFGDQVGDWGRLLAEIGHHVAKSAPLNGFMSEEAAQAALREAFIATFETRSGRPTSGKLRRQIKH
jgi:hypothetical protein